MSAQHCLCAVYGSLWLEAGSMYQLTMQVFSHPHVSVQKAKQERYNARLKAFLDECDDIQAQKQYRVLYNGVPTNQYLEIANVTIF
jgi:3'-phosphoadenosine 5'-phosphosulfate sulfotransferase